MVGRAWICQLYDLECCLDSPTLKWPVGVVFIATNQIIAVGEVAGDGHTAGGQVDEEFPRYTEALVDLEGVVDVRVVDQTLPAHCSPGLFEVGAHNDEDVVLELVGELLEALAVLNGCGRVVDRARADHDQETVILLCDDLRGLLAALDDSLFRVCWDGELVAEQCRGDQRIVAEDWIG